MNWFAKNGDRTLTLIAGICALLITDAKALGLSVTVLAWIGFASGALSFAHTIYFPNNQGTSK